MCIRDRHYGLDHLTVIVDRNRIQQGDFTENTIRMEPLAARFAAFGFAVEEIDGHSTAALFDRLSHLPLEKGKPTCLIANTVKGNGVSFAENQICLLYTSPQPTIACWRRRWWKI